MFRNISEVKKRHKESGGHFFDRGAMSYFNSKVESPLIGGRYFVTSERYLLSSPKKFTVRQVVDNGDRVGIESLSEFQEFDTLDEALMFLGDPIEYRAYQQRIADVIEVLREQNNTDNGGK